MDKEDYSVIFFPGTTASPKRFRISRRWFRIYGYSALVILLGVASTFVYFSQKYYYLANDDIELTELRRESKIRKIQAEKIATQVKNLESEMARLGRFEKKLRVITALENSPQNSAKNWGVGGAYGLSSHSLTTSLAHESKALANRLANNLGHLTAQAKIKAISLQELDHFLRTKNPFFSPHPLSGRQEVGSPQVLGIVNHPLLVFEKSMRAGTSERVLGQLFVRPLME